MSNILINNLKKTFKSFFNILPLIFGTVLTISLIFTIIPKDFYVRIFTGNTLTDSLIGSLIGSISAGNAITSYILGGELLNQGIGLIAVTAFLVSWVTVGIIQLPIEIKTLGFKFAVIRNILCFCFSIIVAIITVLICQAI